VRFKARGLGHLKLQRSHGLLRLARCAPIEFVRNLFEESLYALRFDVREGRPIGAVAVRVADESSIVAIFGPQPRRAV
jgi:hypothetical protein